MTLLLTLTRAWNLLYQCVNPRRSFLHWVYRACKCFAYFLLFVNSPAMYLISTHLHLACWWLQICLKNEVHESDERMEFNQNHCWGHINATTYTTFDYQVKQYISHMPYGGFHVRYCSEATLQNAGCFWNCLRQHRNNLMDSPFGRYWVKFRLSKFHLGGWFDGSISLDHSATGFESQALLVITWASYECMAVTAYHRLSSWSQLEDSTSNGGMLWHTSNLTFHQQQPPR